ncbi:glycosyltransferase family 4 protein [Stratiformator vulcanicus]|uniref:Glycosyltransferase EpsD n=1 Tax=Stratiformator vulcanicus TaxID=2527980 RepID=A0A517R042_9PLAN|nr:glycosyltransferase family 4 protein [Stratiformator vulcanicus]QDT37251.1 Putative glycosyltransferase EpsD [Stratiformator vulcanicus]
MRTAHVITRMIIGGAQENTLLTVEGQHRDYGDEVALVTGPTIGPEGSLIDRARRGGFPVIEVPNLIRAVSPIDEWKALRQLTEALCEYAPQIVHTHSGKAGVLGRAAAAKLGIPVVHTVHGPSFFRGQSALPYMTYRAAELWAARRTDRFITVCDAMADQYADAGVAPREKFVTIYSGMDVEPFLQPPRSPREVRSKFGFTSTDIVVGKIARLFHKKGHEFVLRCAADVVRQNSRVKFLFVGDGILRESLEQQIADAGLTDHFRFTGLVPPDRVPELIHAMDIVVHTSLREGLARVLPQGLIAGKPVVSYDIDGAREVCITGETGCLLPPESISELTAALTELAGDARLREKLGSAGRERFTEQFRHQTMTRRIREVYADVMSQRNAGRLSSGRTAS